ncbi:MAG: 16S rRNA (uracil(1498)-N(3))-methyltransferase, partial [Actinomycetota bacterium]
SRSESMKSSSSRQPSGRLLVRATVSTTAPTASCVRPACRADACTCPAVHLGIPLVDVIALSGAGVADPDGVAPSAEHRLLIVGPEGGFDTDEIPPSITRINIGPAVLRAETAALVAGARLVAIHA